MTKSIRIRLEGNYTLKLDGLYCTTYDNKHEGGTVEVDSEGNTNIVGGQWVVIPRERKSKYQVGKDAILVSQKYVGLNPSKNIKTHYYLSFDLEGVPGNSDSSIKRTEGWRGTNNDLSMYAHGIVKIRSMRKLKNGTISITVK